MIGVPLRLTLSAVRLTNFQRSGKLPKALAELYEARKAVNTYAVAIGVRESYVILYEDSGSKPQLSNK